MNASRRIEWLDIAKGIAIILVVIGHSPATPEMKSIIYAFHIPLFFFLSGFVFNPQKNNDTPKFIFHKIKILAVPYFVFSLIGYLIYILWEKDVFSTNFSTYAIIKGFIIASATTMKIDTVLWFLPCLFIVQLLFHFITKISINQTYLVIIIIASSILGHYYSELSKVRLPWFIDASFTALVFFGVGFIFKTHNDFIEKRISRYNTEILIGSALLLYIFSKLNSKLSSVDMFGLVYHNYFYYYLAAFFGIIFCIVISKIINQSKSLSFIGKTTILIFAFHSHMFVILNFFLGSIRTEFNLTFVVTSSLKWSMLYTSLSIILLIPIIIIVNIISTAVKNKRVKALSLQQEPTLL
ncbi:acyltransferase family protein [Paenibacillus sp. FSL L8-0638]|uniref:acyltransferase family protein n=1 Tax=Paenibacillus TaxID=44249 RepID=UPI00315845B5